MAEHENGSTPTVEDHDGISCIRSSENVRNWNNINYALGLSGKNTNAKNLSMNVATVPPGGVAYAHIHDGFEVMLYILHGNVRHEYGEGCKKVVENKAGDFIFIEPGVPHEVFNMSDTEPIVAVVARSAADEWDKIIPYNRNTATSG
ncbi:MAG: cupin domain-containing protein [Chloroflexota bacterium]|nr:cupin domain-containing protein [Chloroflexota bacterium]MDQ6905451.1 cupin domain-containing protein [Chloroflexota bacterium]